MRIKSIEFKNFASYGNKVQTLSFEEDKAELFLTLGKNGDGKTTIANAIVFALYGKLDGVKMQELPNRINKNLMVRVKLQCKDIDVEIERGLAPNHFKVLLNGVEFDKAGKKSVQDYLEEEVYGIPYHVFKNIIILSVNDFKSFLTMSGNDKKQIIDKMFGFSILNDMQKAVKEERRSIKMDLDSFERDLKQINESMVSVQMKLNQLLSESDQVNKDKIQELKDKLIHFDENKKKLEEAKEKIKLSIGKETKSYEIANNKHNILKYELAELKKKLALYEQGTCPTCEAPLTGDFHQHRKDELTQSVESMPDKIKEAEEQVNTIRQLTIDLKAKESQILDKASMLNSSIRTLKAELLKIKEGLENNGQFDHLKQIINDFEQKENQTGQQKDKSSEEYLFLEAVEEILGEDGVKNLAVKTILPGLNANIAAMSQTMHIPFQIKFNDKFDCIITHLGQEINAMTLSTGERKKADFIIIIAIIKILKLRFPQLNLLFLDELLSSVDQDGIYNILKILSQVIKESKINTFVINHTPLPHEIFDKKLQIYRDNGFSKFEIEVIE
jgi:DNA repair exonuclease SbcCD ATPase subunit